MFQITSPRWKHTNPPAQIWIVHQKLYLLCVCTWARAKRSNQGQYGDETQIWHPWITVLKRKRERGGLKEDYILVVKSPLTLWSQWQKKNKTRCRLFHQKLVYIKTSTSLPFPSQPHASNKNRMDIKYGLWCYSEVFCMLGAMPRYIDDCLSIFPPMLTVAIKRIRRRHSRQMEGQRNSNKLVKHLALQLMLDVNYLMKLFAR